MFFKLTETFGNIPDVFRHNKKFMVFSGYGYWIRDVKYRVYHKAVLYIVTTLIALILIALVQSVSKSINNVIENLSTATIHFLGFFRYCLLVVKHDKFLAVMDFLNEPNFHYTTSAYAKRLKWRNYKINYAFICISYFLAIFCTIFWFLFPLVGRAQSVVKFPVPQDVYLPIEMNDDNFWYLYLFVCILIFMSSLLVVATSTQFYTFFIFIGVEYRILGESYRQIIRPDERPFNFYQIRGAMQRNIKRHGELLAITKKFMDLTYVLLFVQLASNGLLICFATYKTSQVESLVTIEFLAMASYTTYTMFDFFIYCFFGQEITSASLDISTEIYASNWNHLYFEQNHQAKILSLKPLILLPMMQSQNAVVFEGAGILTLSLSTYLKIIKTSYSLLTILINS